MTFDAQIALEVAPCDSCGCAYTVDRLHCVWVEGADGDWCYPCIEAYREQLEATA